MRQAELRSSDGPGRGLVGVEVGEPPKLWVSMGISHETMGISIVKLGISHERVDLPIKSGDFP